MNEDVRILERRESKGKREQKLTYFIKDSDQAIV